MELAVLLSKPLYLHSRLATEDFLNILAEYGFGDGLKVSSLFILSYFFFIVFIFFLVYFCFHFFSFLFQPPVPCCVHCFTGETDELETYLKWGFYIGLTGYIMKMDTGKRMVLSNDSL